MDDIAKRIASLSPEKKALLELQLHKKRGLKEPIAIIGMGCRFAGAKNPQAFWQLLKRGGDAITEVPADRWDVDQFYDADPTVAGKLYCRWGGFLDQVDQFDPDFFGIAPREATYIDPQQRLLLEVVWEALEDAGQIPEQLSGSQTSIFVGLSTNDYGQILLRDPATVDTYTNTGIASTMIANRVSYLFNFRGPSLAIDTACSSSLVAIQLACQSLWRGEASLALAGGVNLILTPSLTVGFSKLTALSPDGRCKAFDASANGFVRSEGAGMVVLKPFSQAIADRDNIYALIRGGAVNQDGRSNGLTAPNREAQEAVLLAACAEAGVSPAQIQYIEAHGTGTLLGDPIEAKALGNVRMSDRLQANGVPPLRIGSVKSNIGHTEAAAGVASLIKVALCLKHQTLVPSLHFDQPNPLIPFDTLPLQVQQTCEPWPTQTGPRLAGVSSFGFGGTNAHFVLQSAPDLSPCSLSEDRPCHLLTLSAKSPRALQQLSQRYADWLVEALPSLSESFDASLANACFTANTGRSQFTHRLAVVAATAEQLVPQLVAFATEQPTHLVYQGQMAQLSSSQPVVFLFTGQGSQYPDMGRELYTTQPVFRQALERCQMLLQPHLDRPLLDILYGEAATAVDETVYTQPALFALEYALSELWKSWGVTPAAVLGHSVGEYVAACVSGVFSLEDGLKLMAERGRLIQSLPSNGMMAAVFADADTVAQALPVEAQTVTLATLNGPQNTVIAGEQMAVKAVLATLQRQGIRSQPLAVSHAFHSPLMEPILDLFEHLANQLTFGAPRLPLISNVTGTFWAEGQVPDAAYWRRHLRQPVRFAEGLAALRSQGHNLFLEIGPQPILSSMGKRFFPEGTATWLPSLRQGQSDWQVMLSSLGQLFVQGVAIDAAGLDQPYPRRRLSLPTYPFERSRYWVDLPTVASGLALPAADDPIEPHTPDMQPEPAVDFQDWLYQIRWQPKTRPDQYLGRPPADFFPTPLEVAQALQPRAEQLAEQYQLSRYEPLAWELDRLSAAYVWQALQQLGWQPNLGETVTVAPLASQLGVRAHHHRLLRRMLEILAEEGWLTAPEADWRVQQFPATSDPEQLRQILLSQYPDCETELTLLGRCGQNLSAVLRGDIDPLQLLFPEDSSITAEQLYQDSPVAQVFNTLVQDAIATALAHLPNARTVRILEIGAGTGGTTTHVLPKLLPEHTDYVFTDISSLFTSRAVQKFSDYPFLQFHSLDIEKDPEKQGFAPHQFDLILAANVIHATQDLSQTLNHLKQLLAPNGYLVLLEGTSRQRWMDLIFGLTEGWWRFTDTARRPHHPLLTQSQWQRLFEQMGFTASVTIPQPVAENRVLAQQSVILAQAAAAMVPPSPLSPTPMTTSGTWLILTDSQGVGAQMANQLTRQNHPVVLVSRGETNHQLSPTHFEINPDQLDAFPQLLQQLSSHLPLQGVVHLWSLDTPALTIYREQPDFSEMTIQNRHLSAATQLSCRTALSLIQALIAAELTPPPQLWLVTEQSQAILKDDRVNLGQSPLWGLGRVIAREYPEFWGGLIDLEAGDPTRAAHQLLAQLSGPASPLDGENQIAFRRQQRYVARLHHPALPALTIPANFKADATYLITGGLGGLGLKVAEWMVLRGARHLVLVSRRPATADATQLLQTLSAQGAQVEVRQADVTQFDQMAHLWAEIHQTLPPVLGIIHSAGVLADGLMPQQDWVSFSQVLAPKVQGAWYLHQLSQTQPLDFFILFSSAAALLGPPAQANHAAANTFLDALAHARRQQGLPALAINWGIWSQVGAAAERQVDQRLQLQGVGTIDWPQGLQILEQLVQQSVTQVGVLPVDWPVFLSQLADKVVPPFLQQVVPLDWQGQTDDTGPSAVLNTFLTLAEHEREAFIQCYLQQQIGRALGSQAQIPLDRNVTELGMDSLMVVDVLNACKRDLQVVLYPREFYERPEIATLAPYLTQEVSRVYDLSLATSPETGPSTTEPIQTWTWSSQQTVRTYRQPTQRIPGIIFVLSSPRAGSTLLRVMLAGHPQLFSPPELHLLPFETMAEWQAALSLSYLGEGLQRAYMELTAADAHTSKLWLDNLINTQQNTQSVYAELQALASPRQLVDKSPTYAGNLQTLQRAESLFEGAKYVHLVRHPHAVIESLVRNRMDKILGIVGGNPYDLAEQVWMQSNRNILDFQQQLESNRYHQVCYENLVASPTLEMEKLCDFLGIPFADSLLNPYEGKRMTDGVYAQSMPINDPNFLQHRTIDSNLADAWKKVTLPQPLGPATLQVMTALGYALPSQPPQNKPKTPMRETFVTVNGLSLCICSWGPVSGPLVLCLHGALEHGAAWNGVAQGLANRGYWVVAPDLRGHGRSEHAPNGNGYQLMDYLADVDALLRQLRAQPSAIAPALTGQFAPSSIQLFPTKAAAPKSAPASPVSPETAAPIILVGHSMGSVIAATFASVRPEAVAALVMVEPVLPAAGNDQETRRQLANHLDYLATPPRHPNFSNLETVVERIQRSTPHITPAQALKTAQRLTEPCAKGYRWRWDARLQIRTGLGFSGTALGRQQYLTLLQQLTLPITVVYGDASNFNKAEDLALQASALATAQRVTLPGGHNLPIDAPTELAAMIAAVQSSS